MLSGHGEGSLYDNYPSGRRDPQSARSTGVNALLIDGQRDDMGIKNSLLARATARLALIVKAFAALSKDFARSHPLLTATVATTVTAHIAHAVWARVVDSQEAPLALGIAVIIGYALVLLGAVQAFIRERQRSRGR